MKVRQDVALGVFLLTVAVAATVYLLVRRTPEKLRARFEERLKQSSPLWKVDEWKTNHDTTDFQWHHAKVSFATHSHGWVGVNGKKYAVSITPWSGGDTWYEAEMDPNGRIIGTTKMPDGFTYQECQQLVAAARELVFAMRDATSP